MRKVENKIWMFMLMLIINLHSLIAQNEKQKRQIFREQVLPALGGKIPEEAFRADRLALNRLNKEGITVPDGVLLDARDVVKNTDPVISKPEIIKVYLTSDGRYVPPEGRNHYQDRKTVDTTYLIRMPISKYTNYPRQQFHLQNFYKTHTLNKLHNYPTFSHFVSTPPPPYETIISPLVLPTSAGLLGHSYYPKVWHFDSTWDFAFSPTSSYIFADKLNPFHYNPITDYLHHISPNFHDRSLRHINSGQQQNTVMNFSPQQLNAQKIQNTSSYIPENKINNSKIVGKINTSGYTSLTKVPPTSFTCGGRTGTFADIETKCQVFHECTAWSKTTSLCPQGTAYSEVKKRCEWWHDVVCVNS